MGGGGKGGKGMKAAKSMGSKAMQSAKAPDMPSPPPAPPVPAPAPVPEAPAPVTSDAEVATPETVLDVESARIRALKRRRAETEENLFSMGSSTPEVSAPSILGDSGVK